MSFIQKAYFFQKFKLQIHMQSEVNRAPSITSMLVTDVGDQICW